VAHPRVERELGELDADHEAAAAHLGDRAERLDVLGQEVAEQRDLRL